MTKDNPQPTSASVHSDGYWWYQARGPLLEQALGAHLPAAATVLDVGSADGPSAAWIRERSDVRVVSLDLDPCGLATGGICGSVTELPFEAQAFDAVCAFDVIEHCQDEERALAEVRRVLRPGGAFLMAVPAYQWAWSVHDVASGHHRRYTIGRARRALEANGFVVDRSTYGFAAVFPLFALQRAALRISAPRTPSDIEVLPKASRPLHHALMALCRVDELLLRRTNLPFGSSVFVAARRVD